MGGIFVILDLHKVPISVYEAFFLSLSREGSGISQVFAQSLSKEVKLGQREFYFSNGKTRMTQKQTSPKGGE
jgi:hypothetical protein